VSIQNPLQGGADRRMARAPEMALLVMVVGDRGQLSESLNCDNRPINGRFPSTTRISQLPTLGEPFSKSVTLFVRWQFSVIGNRGQLNDGFSSLREKTLAHSRGKVQVVDLAGGFILIVEEN
jgi:hypothetical protein